MMCIVTMICWGSWANTQKLVSGKEWPFQLFYWDFTIGVFLIAILLAFTMGSFGDVGRSFLSDLGQSTKSALFQAFLGGVIFNASNLLLVIAIEIVGMAVAFPIGVGLALVIGVIITYAQNPIGNPVILFLGVLLVVSAIILSALSYKRLQTRKSKNINLIKGLVVSMFAGVLMGSFFGFIMASIGTANFAHLLPGKLSPYTAIVISSLGILISNFVWNSINMYKPITGSPCKYSEYISKGTFLIHLVGVFGGVIWGIGTSFNIIASGVAGPSISYGLGQGATLVAGIWGVFIWKEFKGSSRSTNSLLFMMFLCYVIGLFLVVISRLI